MRRQHRVWLGNYHRASVSLHGFHPSMARPQLLPPSASLQKSAMSSGSRGSNTSVGGADADTCAWVGGAVCGTPRSCRACLNEPVSSGDEVNERSHGLIDYGCAPST